MELIEKVKEAKKTLKDAQKDLLTWCQDKNNPLKERWEVWEKYVDKHEFSCMQTGKSKILNDLSNWWFDRSHMDRHSTVDYGYIMECLCETYEEGEQYENKKGNEHIINIINKHIVELRDRKIESILSDSNTQGVIIHTPTSVKELEIFLQEEIIKSNFGSTTYDW